MTHPSSRPWRQAQYTPAVIESGRYTVRVYFHVADHWLIAVIDCCHAQEEKDEEQTHEVEDCNCKTGQEVLGCQTSATSDKDPQEKTIEEEDILKNRSAG